MPKRTSKKARLSLSAKLKKLSVLIQCMPVRLAPTSGINLLCWAGVSTIRATQTSVSVSMVRTGFTWPSRTSNQAMSCSMTMRWPTKLWRIWGNVFAGQRTAERTSKGFRICLYSGKMTIPVSTPLIWRRRIKSYHDLIIRAYV